MKRKICVVTGNRAEFGLLVWLMTELKNNQDCVLQIIATGAHLSPEFGNTYQDIEEAGFAVDERVDMLLSSDSPVAITKSMGLGIIGLSDALSRLAPDLLVILGDRFEIFSAASAAMILGIRIAHIHGGEVTEGAFDEAIRHSITKMSHLHFVATEQYRNRVIQLGENPESVYNVGGLGVDAIHRIKLMDKPELEKSIGFEFQKENLLVCFHPVTLYDEESSLMHMRQILTALAELGDLGLIFTMPNADPGGRELTKLVVKFVESHQNAAMYKSLGQLRYFSCLAHVDGIIGNSSSGLLEAPSFGIGTVNIGDRQAGRLHGSSVINSSTDKNHLLAAIRHILSDSFKASIKSMANPYGTGNTVEKIIEVISKTDLKGRLVKKFHDINIVKL